MPMAAALHLSAIMSYGAQLQKSARLLPHGPIMAGAIPPRCPMQTGKCQICGRRLRLKKSAEVAMHYRHGTACPGSGFAPIEIDDSRLAEVARNERERALNIAKEIRIQIEARVNRIEPELIKRQIEASTQANKLEAKLRRLNKWPERFARQMENHGYGDPPPPDIAARYAANDAKR